MPPALHSLIPCGSDTPKLASAFFTPGRARWPAGLLLPPAAAWAVWLLSAGCPAKGAVPGAPTPAPPQQTIAGALAGAGNSLSVPGLDGWYFLEKELRHLIAPKFWGDGVAAVPGDPLPAILDFKEQLDRAGVDLLLVPVPAKSVICPDKLPWPPQTGGMDREFYKVLESHGVKVLDLTDTFLASKGNVYCRQDSHWSPEGIELAAKEIAGRIRDLPWVKGRPKIPMESEVLPLTITGDLAPPGAAPETFPARFVRPAGSKQPIPPSKESPLILLGDSHNLIFHAGGDMHAEGAGLPDLLALELGFPVDVVAVRGSGATPARRNLARRKDNLTGRRLVVWCFSSREFTEGQGWSKVPVVKTPAQSGP
ncbi:MAG: hypothetical protein WCS65_02365 [Verrucomicrobiae bacterium]